MKQGRYLLAFLLVLVASFILLFPHAGTSVKQWTEPRIPGTSETAVTLGRDLDGDGDPDEVTINLEVIEVQESIRCSSLSYRGVE